MKKLMTMMAFVAVAFGANAQEGFSKGSVLLGGDVSFSTEKYTEDDDGEVYDYKENQITFSPKIGYFVSNNIAVGIEAGIGSTKMDYEGYEETYSEFSFGAFGRYYFTPASKFSMFMELGAGYASDKYKEESDEIYKGSGFYAGLAPGLHYFISNRLALEASMGILGFRTMKWDYPDYPDYTEKQNDFNFSFGLREISLGLIFKLK